MGKEVEVYVLHITQNNSLSAICNEQFLAIMNKHEAYFLAPEANPNPIAYLGTYLFRTEAQRRAFARDCKKMRIDFVYEPRMAYADEMYLEGNSKT